MVLLHQMLTNELDRGIELEVSIVLLSKAVPFVLGHQIPNRAAIRLNLGHHLLRFAQWNPRIVATLHDEKWLGDTTGVVQRRDLFKNLAISGSRSSPYSTRRKSRR